MSVAKVGLYPGRETSSDTFKTPLNTVQSDPIVYHHDNHCLGVTVTFVTSQLRQQLCSTVTGPVWQ